MPYRRARMEQAPSFSSKARADNLRAHPSRIHRLRPVAVALIASAMFSAAAPCHGIDLVDTVPREAIVAVMLNPPGTGQAGSTRTWGINLAAFLLQQARQTGWASDADDGTVILVDALASLPLAGRYPLAVSLFEARARKLPTGARRLAGMRAAILLRTGNESGPVARRVQELLNLHSDKQHSRIVKRQTDDLNWYELSDTRWPEWAILEWGPIDGFYVAAIGQGTWAAVARTLRGENASLRADSWFQASHNACRGADAYLEIYLNADALHSQLGDVMEGTPEQVATALGLGDVQRGLWAVGRVDRFVSASCVLRTADGDRHIPITVLPRECPRAAAAVPPEATTCAILRCRPTDLILRARDAYLASQRESSRQRWMSLWNEHVAGPDWSVQADLLDQLGDHIVIHNDPPHPLGIPLLCMILVEIEGSADRVSASIDRLFAALEKYLGGARPEAEAGVFEPVLRQAADGVWYMQMGLYGPALAVTDHWVVIGYAPDAVRRNVAFLRQLPTTQPSTTRTTVP
jgi:hypothetical protein